MRLLPQAGPALHAHILGKAPPKFPDVSGLLEKFPDPLMEYVYTRRSEMTLSQHPRLKRLHPDYDPASGQDHDPMFMTKEVRRWSPKYLDDELKTMQSGLTGIPKNKLGSTFSEFAGGC